MSDEGASPRELLLESCRRNNTDLLSEILATFSSSDEISHFLNTATDGLGCGALHIAAQYGAYEVLDMLLDQEGVEIDLTERRDGDTCLHRSVRYVNGLDKEEWEDGARIVEILIDAGCDPRLRNKAKLRPIDLTDPRNKEVRDMLQKAEFAVMAGDDVVDEDAEDDDEDAGPPSDNEL